MGAVTHIQWTDRTFNPWEGCTKVSPGCLHCYAETRNQRFSGGANWGKGAPRRRTSKSNWNQPLRWNLIGSQANSLSEKLGGVARRQRVFCASLADWLDDEVPIEWLADLLALIKATPNLDWQLLTKRPENWFNRVGEVIRLEIPVGGEAHDRCSAAAMAAAWLNGAVPSNVWIGTTVEDQQRADERIPLLLAIPAKVRFLSCEPLLGLVNLSTGFAGPQTYPLGRGINWVICGGESGPGARPMHPAWARSIRDQCRAAEVPFFMKQMGGPRKPFPEIPTDLNMMNFPDANNS